MRVFFLRYLALSEDTELEKGMSGGRASRMATQLPSAGQGYQDAGQLKVHLLL